MAIKVTKFRPMDKGVLRGFISIEWSFYIKKLDETYFPVAIEINDIALFDGQNGRGLGLPNQTYTTSGGETKRKYYMWIANEAVREAFTKQVLAALDKYIEENPTAAPKEASAPLDDDIPF